MGAECVDGDSIEDPYSCECRKIAPPLFTGKNCSEPVKTYVDALFNDIDEDEGDEQQFHLTVGLRKMKMEQIGMVELK